MLQLYIKIMVIHCDISKTTLYSFYQINVRFHLCDIVVGNSHDIIQPQCDKCFLFHSLFHKVFLFYLKMRNSRVILWLDNVM